MIEITRIRIYIEVQQPDKSAKFATNVEVEDYRRAIAEQHATDGHTVEVLFDKKART